MDPAEWLATYGPLAKNPPHKVGETLIFEGEDGLPENGEILYVAQTANGLEYVVSPAEDIFPRPVWPEQIITAM